MLGRFDQMLLRLDLRAAGVGQIHPRLHLIGLRTFQRKLIAQFLQVAEILAGDLHQRFARGVDRILRGDHLRDGRVVLRARDVHVGDRRQADFVALFGLIELLEQRLLVELRELELVLGGEHAEVGGRGAHHQVLRGGVVIAIGTGGGFVRLAQALDVAPVEDRLRQRALRLARTRFR